MIRDGNFFEIDLTKISFLAKNISYFTYDVSTVFDIIEVLKTYSENGVKRYVDRS